MQVLFVHSADKVSNIARLNLIIFNIIHRACEESFMQIRGKLELAKVSVIASYEYR